MAGRRPKRQARPEYNYMKWVLLVIAIAGGYYGWKFGPGLYQRFMVNDIAHQCAAKLWVMQDNLVMETVLTPQLAKQKLVLMSDDVEVDLKRDEDEGRTRSCTIKFKYRNTHVWGAEIEKWYEVRGFSTRTK